MLRERRVANAGDKPRPFESSARTRQSGDVHSLQVVQIRQIRVGEGSLRNSLEHGAAPAREGTGSKHEVRHLARRLAMAEEDDPLVRDERVEQQQDRMGKMPVRV